MVEVDRRQFMQDEQLTRSELYSWMVKSEQFEVQGIKWVCQIIFGKCFFVAVRWPSGSILDS